MLVEIDDTLKRAYLPHCGVISLVVKLARGEQIQVAMIGRDSVFGAFSALGDPIALNSAVVLIPGVASALGVDRLRDAADQSTTFRATLMRHGLAVYAQIQQTVGCNSSTPWNPGWRDACYRRAISPAATNCFSPRNPWRK